VSPFGDTNTYILPALTVAGANRRRSHRTGRRAIIPNISEDPTHGSNSKTICTTPNATSAPWLADAASPTAWIKKTSRFHTTGSTRGSTIKNPINQYPR
jgi:hypothetical protein